MSRSSLKEQLQNVYGENLVMNDKKKTAKKKQRSYFERLPSVSQWEGDGIDHINIYNYGITDLGRTLHPSSLLAFDHDIFGRFNSISAFWDFVETAGRDDRFRFLPHSVRLEAKRKMEQIKVPYLHFMVLDACWQRIRSYELLVDALKNTDLPFDSYKLNGDMKIPQRMNHVEWLVEGLDFIRTSLKKDQVPNFVRWSSQRKRREIMQEYTEMFIRKPGMVQEPKDNQLLKELAAQGPTLKPVQKKFKPSLNKKPKPVEETSKEVETDVVTTEQTVVQEPVAVEKQEVTQIVETPSTVEESTTA